MSPREEPFTATQGAPAVWSETFRVRAGEIGPGGSLRLPSLFDWLQEAAGNHATALGVGTDALLARGLTWVLSRLTLHVSALPLWREEVAVTTWPSGALRLWALREFRVSGADGRALAEGTSGWLILRLPSKRPARLPEEVERFARNAPPRVLEDAFAELPAAAGSAGTAAFRVGRFDLDLNAHANNVAILRWLLEAAPGEALSAPLVLQADFRGECFEGDALRGRVAAADGEVRLGLVREADGREVARAVARPGLPR